MADDADVQPELVDTTDWTSDKPRPVAQPDPGVVEAVVEGVVQVATMGGAPQLAGVPPLTGGIYYDVPHERYHGDPCPAPALSASMARIVLESPLKAWHAHPRLGGAVADDDEPEEDPKEETAARTRGSILDALIFGGEVKVAVIDANDFRTKWAKEAREEAIAAGEIPILMRRYERIRASAEAIRGNLTAALEGAGYPGGLCGKSQVTMIWQQENGVWCKARTDHLILYGTTLPPLDPSAGPAVVRYLIFDLKSSYDASPAGAAKSMNTYGAGIQRAAYIDGFETLHPELAGRGDMIFGYAEPNPPYDCTLNRCNGEMRELGERQWRRAIKKWEACVRTDSFPGYPKHVLDVEPRAWLLQQDEEQQIADQGEIEPPPFMKETP